MHILVTGANGFIGSALCRRLVSEGHTVRALVRPGSQRQQLAGLDLQHIAGDVTVAHGLEAALEGVEVVAHLAGVTSAVRSQTFDRVNHQGTAHLAEAAARSGVKRIVFTSSLSAQGPSQPGSPHVYPGSERPINAYGRSKLAAEQALRRGPVPSVILRPSVVYGPGDRELLTLIQLLRTHIVPLVSDFSLSLIHVSDVVEALSHALTAPQHPQGPLFLSHPTPLRLEQLFDHLERALGSPPSLRLTLPTPLIRALAPVAEGLTQFTGLAPFAARTVRELGRGPWTCLPTQLTQTTGFQARVEHAVGLKEVVEWYQQSGWL